MGKTIDAVQVLARAVMSVPIGGQVPTTLELAKDAKTGNGTVQAALKHLEGTGAVALSAHGSSGRRVVAKDLAALWTASGRGAFTGVMPLPESREFAGLATALSEAAERRGVHLQLLFRQGSAVRLKFLESERVDFTIMSAAVALAQSSPVSALTLAPHTYYRKDSVVVVTAAGASVGTPTRVPVDRNSADHVRLTRHEFPDAELVDTPYSFVPELIVSGDFEAAVWHQSNSSPLLVASGLSIHPLSRPRDAAGDALDRAALVWRSADTAVGGIVSEFFEASFLERIQSEVMNGTRIPQY